MLQFAGDASAKLTSSYQYGYCQAHGDSRDAGLDSNGLTL